MKCMYCDTKIGEESRTGMCKHCREKYALVTTLLCTLRHAKKVSKTETPRTKWVIKYPPTRRNKFRKW
jgi:hypothetical protein